IDQGRQWIGVMGRMVEGKGLSTLMETFAALRTDHPRALLLFIGDGPMREQLEVRARALHLADSVVFVGEDPDARLWLSALDIFCFLSEDEGMPNAVLEAACAGVPIAGWRTPFLEEALGPEAAAALVTSRAAEDLRAGLSRLLANAGEA